jgi:flagellar basal-body rod protein FlgG
MKLTKILFLITLSTSSFAMMRALNTAATGMAAQEMHVNTISNNVANLNTTAYKKQRAEMEDLLYETVTEAGARSAANTRHNVGLQVGSGSRVSAVRKEFTQGSPKLTNNPFDLMINGEGFFGILLPNGTTMYTRDGSFNVDSTGTLVNRAGYRLFPGITFPPGTQSVNITEDGTVEYYINGQTQPNVIGQVPIFTFINQVGLKSHGGNLYRETATSGQPIQNVAGTSNAGRVQQGALESSNVSIMNEMTGLIRAQRAYEMNSKVMGVSDQMLQTVNNIR